MKKYFVVLSALILMAFSSCQKFAGDPISKDFSISGTYSELEVSSAFDVTVSDAVSQITVTVGENIMPKVVVEKEGNTLKIYCKPLTIPTTGEMKVTLPYNADLTSVELSGASEFHSEYGLRGEKVEVDLSGASDFYCNIDADEVDVDLSGNASFCGDILAGEIDMDLSGSSDVEGNVSADELELIMTGASDATLVGQVAKLKIDLSGSSNIVKTVVGNQYGLVCDQCQGVMSGSSDAYIHCDGSIIVDLSGGSELHFTGSAFTGDCTTSGGSEVVHDVNP